MPGNGIQYCSARLAREEESRAVTLTAAALSVYRVAFRVAVPDLSLAALCIELSLKIVIAAVAAVTSAAAGAPAYRFYDYSSAS